MFRIAGNATGDIPSGLGSRDELAATTPQAIGKIQAALGSATITRARDIVVQVRIGALVYQGDVIETAADGAVAIMFKDGTAFNLSTSARMVLNEFICDPNANSNSARFGIAQGIFAFRAGKVAKSGGLSIDTPVARIRGATQGSGTGILTLAALTFAVTNDLHAHSQLAILDDDVITYKDLPHGTFEIVTRGGQIILADDPGETIRIDSAGNVTRVLLPSSRVAELQQAAHAVSLLSQDAGTAPGSGGSPSDSGGGTPDFLRLLPINYTSPPAIESLTITPFKDPFVFEPPPAPIFPHVVVTGTATEGSPMLLTGTLAGLGAVQAAGPDGLLGTFDDVLISPASFSLSSNTSGLPVLLAHGHVVSYSVAGNVLTASADGQMLFTLSLGAVGSWSFELLSQIDHVDDGTNSANTALRLAGGGSVNSIDFSSIILADGVPLTGGSFSVTVIDATPSVSGNGLVQLDDDALAGGNAGGTGDDPDATNTSGVLAHSYGADGAGSIAFLTSGAPSGFTYELSGGDLLVKQGTTVVLTVTLDTTTGAYKVTQNNPILHAAGSDENNQTFAISYEVTDADGDTATGTFSINVDDDSPTATAEASQNVAEDATVTGTLDFVAGADGATVTHINGTALGFGEDGYSQAIDIGEGAIKVKADGSYKFTADDPVIGTGAASATFTVTDRDGDTATAAVSFVITDDNVPTGGTTAAAVDDDGLPGGNPASVTGDLAVPDSDGDSNEATFGGTLAFSFGGDGAGTVDFAAVDGTTGTVGQETVHYSWNAASNTLTATGPRGVLFRVVVTNPATGTYAVTLVDNVLQAQGPNAENDATAALTYTIADSDGSSTTGTLNITFDDDAPTATAEASQSLAEGATVTGTLDFVAGADGATVTHINGTALVFGEDGYSQAIDIGDGAIKVRADGSYSFAADNPTTSPVPLTTATFTVTDGDGDTATANVSFQVIDANTPTSGTASAAVDDDGLNGGNPASTTFDLNANTGDAPGDTSEATFMGVLGGSVGLDVPGTFSFAALNGTTGTVGTETVSYSWNSGSNTLTATGPRGVLFTVVVTNPVTGAYTVTLLDNVLHAGGPNQENATDPATSLNYTITDADGSFVTGTLTITFDDDAPTATAEASQNVAEGATVTGTFDFVAGADGATVTHINGTVLVFNPEDSNYSQAIAIGGGSIKVKVDGSYSFTANNPTTSPAPLTTATFTVTDGDGDTATANVSFQVIDANTPTSGTASAAVDDDGLNGGNPASTTFDLNANTGDAPGDTSEATFTGVLGGSVGLDVPGTFSFAALNGTTGTVGTETVSYSWNSGSNTLTATVNAGPRNGTALFTVAVTNPAMGAYKVTLLDNVLHAGGPNQENATDPTTSLNYTITDADGSVATGTLTITFDDDAPTAISPEPASLPNSATATVTVVLDNNVGADGPGTLTFVNITNGQDSGFTSDGDPILLFITEGGTVLEGRTDSALIFTVTLNHNLVGSDTYTVTMFDTVDNGSGITFSNLSGGEAGNPPFKIITEPGVSLELLFTPINAGSINSDSDDAGVGSQFIIVGDPDQGLRIDFGDFTSENNGFTIEHHSTVNSFKFSIDQVANGTHADVRLTAVEANDDNNFADDATVTITEIQIYDPSGALVGTLHEDGTIVLSGEDIVVDFEVGGTVLIAGLPQQYSILTRTGAGYDRIEITNAGDSAGDGKFSVSELSIEQTVIGEPVNMTFDVALTDADGDSVVSSIQFTLEPDSGSTLIAPAGVAGESINLGLTASSATADFDLSALFQDTANTQTIVPTDVNGDSTADTVVVMDSLHHTLNSTNFIVS
jgi:Domain of unknown function (DUF5801)